MGTWTVPHSRGHLLRRCVAHSTPGSGSDVEAVEVNRTGQVLVLMGLAAQCVLEEHRQGPCESVYVHVARCGRGKGEGGEDPSGRDLGDLGSGWSGGLGEEPSSGEGAWWVWGRWGPGRETDGRWD